MAAAAAAAPRSSSQLQQRLQHLLLLLGTMLGTKTTLLLLVMSPAAAAAAAAAVNGTDVDETGLLLSFRSLCITEDPSGALSNWSTTTATAAAAASPCSWLRVSCDEAGYVFSLNLSRLHLSGTLSPSAISTLLNLSRLSSLDLSFNNFTGSLDDLSPSSSSTFPPSLTTLNLSDNFLSGSFPSSLCLTNPALTSINLKNNSLSGPIPPSISNCTSLTYLALYYNSFTGSIPSQIGLLTGLRYLALSFNMLNGTVPIAIFTNCTQLGTLAFSDNGLTGEVPAEIGGLTLLEELWLDANLFHGNIPPQLANLSRLTTLQLDTNNLTGTIPPALAQLPSLTKLLSLSNNQLSGTIPAELGNLTKLTIMTLRGNQLSGTIPPDIGRMSSLQGLFLGANLLEGSIPTDISKNVRLARLRIQNNMLSGEIPAWLGSLQLLTELYLYGNRLEGPIPDALANLTKLSDLSLGFNALIGPLSAAVAGMSTLTLNFSLPQNSLNGTLPDSLGRLIHVQTIDLSSNAFTGSVPSSLGDCVGLITLNLSHNSLTGPIPADAFRTLTLLKTLDLSGNALSGEIPSAIADLPDLRAFNFSFNNLSGQIPAAFVNATASSFLSNPGLCGPPLEIACPVAASNSSSKRGVLKKGVRILLIAVAVAVLILAMAIVVGWRLCSCYYQGKRRRRLVDAIREELQNVDENNSSRCAGFTAEELRAATDNFSESKLLGEGSVSRVYKATGLTIKRAHKVDAAVKVMLDGADAQASFLAELAAMANARHRNVVKLHGICDEGELRAFVLEFMVMGSLKKLLHARDAPDLGLFTRLRIATDVAHGLCYLHNGLKKQIVHRDIKPSNILLDADMVAKISDFGIAKRLLATTTSGEGERQLLHSMTQGTLGYVAPEYAESTRVDAKADVYSYGILVLELVTRKAPTDELFSSTGMSLAEWVRDAYCQGRYMDVADPRLRSCRRRCRYDEEEENIEGDDGSGGGRGLDEEDEEEDLVEIGVVVKAFMAVALACTERNPDKRPDMETVLCRMEYIIKSVGDQL